jgi:hypothetical protein
MADKRPTRPQWIKPVLDPTIGRRNARERARIREIVAAFRRLKETLLVEALPNYARDQPMSRLAILKAAIGHLGNLGTQLDERAAPAGSTTGPAAPPGPTLAPSPAPSGPVAMAGPPPSAAAAGTPPSAPPSRSERHPTTIHLKGIIAGQQGELEMLRSMVRASELKEERLRDERIKNKAAGQRDTKHGALTILAKRDLSLGPGAGNPAARSIPSTATTINWVWPGPGNCSATTGDSETSLCPTGKLDLSMLTRRT